MARKVTNQILKIKPCGQIAGGEVSYTYHAVTGELHYQGVLLLWRFVWRRRFPFSGVIQLDARAMLSERAKAGHTICVRNLIVRTDSVDGDTAYCTLDFAGAHPGRGMAAIDLKDEVVRLRWLHAEGALRRQTIFGRQMTYLNVEADDGGN